MEAPVALKVHDDDNVATIFSSGLTAGGEVKVLDKKGNAAELTLISDLPFGHKAALCPINAGESIIKYGEQIGVARKAIRRGEHVHIHNLDSMRGRGDLSREETA